MPDTALPRPFYQSPWPRSLRPAAQALWEWHSGLRSPDAPRLDGSDLTAYFEAEQEKVEESEPLKIVPDAVWKPAYDACDTHGLSRSLLAQQIRGSRILRGPVRFDDKNQLNSFIDVWAFPHALLLAQLAGSGHSWQERPTRELARGFFLTRALASLPQDLENNQLFIPLDDLEQTNVSVEQLERGMIDDGVRRLFWKQSIRIQDALAQGQDLLVELPRRYRNALKRYWLGALEVLSEIKRREYDVWGDPIQLSWFRKTQIWLQSWFGMAGVGSR